MCAVLFCRRFSLRVRICQGVVGFLFGLLQGSSVSYFKERVSSLDCAAGCQFGAALCQAVAVLQSAGNRGFVSDKAALCAFPSGSLMVQLWALL